MPVGSRIGMRLLLVVAAMSGFAAASVAQADTTVLITGIGTSVAGGTIDTHVESVTHTAPVDVLFHGIPAVEIRGAVSGIGWGGSGIVPRAINAQYRYDIPFVARWRRQGACPRLVFFNHGGGLLLMTALRAEKDLGTANPNRFTEFNGDLLAGVPALLDCATYISINRRGLRGDGTFSATYLDSVAPLTVTEVDSIEQQAGIAHPGIVVGAAVPALPTNDAATCRDIARALEQVVGGIQGMRYRTRIAVGTSSGARLFAALNFGRSVIGTQSMRTGGNYTVPYDASSPRLFDGFVLNGFTYVPKVEHADVEFPMTAPTMFLQGQADERYQQHVTMAHELLQKGVGLRGRVWLYEITNLTHVPRDLAQEPAMPSDGDRLGCFVSAALRNLREHLEQGCSPPISRMAGGIINGSLRFDRADGSTTNEVPVPNDPARDSVVVGPLLALKTVEDDETTRWLHVTAVLPHVCDAITPPTVACRLGGYKLTFFGAQLTPFSPAELAAKFGSFECYRACICRTVKCLQAQRLYDQRVESACETAERSRTLFGPTPSNPSQSPPRMRLATRKKSR